MLFMAFPPGCGFNAVPEGLPELTPCSLTIVQEGKPLVGAIVLLYPDNQGCPWTVSGTTNECGVAEMTTHGKYPGIPQGDWSVTVSKNNTVYDKKSEGDNWTIYAKVDPLYSDKETTPLRLRCEAETVKMFDVGPETNIFVSNSRELPELFPCELTFLRDGKPVEGMKILLESKGRPRPYEIGGVTDETGTAVIYTDDGEIGAPRGNYHIRICENSDDSLETGTSDDSYPQKNTDNDVFEVRVKKSDEKTTQTFEIAS